MTKSLIRNILAIALFVLLSGTLLFAEIKNQPAKKEKQKTSDEIQRTYSYGNKGTDLQRNTVSNFQFYTTNYGIFGHNVRQSVGGGHWPRGSQNQYFYGGGIWFAAKKMRPDGSAMKNYVELSYNPNNGNSWMVPGRIEDGDAVVNDNASYQKYRTYFSTDFRASDGQPIIASEGPNWPIWDNSEEDTLMFNRYFGHYIYNENDRNRKTYDKGPAFISGEDIFCVFKDTDLSMFDGGASKRKNEGYPLRLQFENTVYSWGFGDYRDFIFIRYDIINYSTDTLKECWMSPVMDIDIGLTSNSQNGARNDKVRYYDEEDTLNLAVVWSKDDEGEKGAGFGYLGLDFLESPSTYRCEEVIDSVINGQTVKLCAMCIEYEQTDSSEICTQKLYFDPALDGYVRKDARFFKNRYQLGLKTFRNWPIAQDITEDDPRYIYMSAGVRDGESEAGDIRVLMATGPFTMLPKDTVRIIVGIVLARPSVKKEADGTTEDLAELVRKDKFAQMVYDNNFRAPIPPGKCILSWRPLNNAIMVTWDSTSEISNDKLERGLDFLGYRLYRARRNNVDTFDVDQISSSVEYTSGKGPFGWKQVAAWQMPLPFNKSVYRSGKGVDNPILPMIDSLAIVGPVYDYSTNPPTLEKFSIKLMKVGKGVLLASPLTYVRRITPILSNRRLDSICTPVVMAIDTALTRKPWGDYYAQLIKDNDLPLFYDPFVSNPTHHELLDSILLGEIILDQALLSYNPLLWKKETATFAYTDTSAIPDREGDTINFKHTFRNVIVDNSNYIAMDRMVPIDPHIAMRDSNHVKAALDSVYHYIKNKMFEKLIFPDFENTEVVRDSIIPTYMRKLTNNNTFIDIGDDNFDYTIYYDEDPKKTEKIINNVEYYYKMLAYDEGDYTQPTEYKLNDGSVGNTNVVTSYAKAAPIGNKSAFEITFIDQDKIGGLYNFKMFAIDQDRVNQLFGDGRELELEFQPYWYKQAVTLTGRQTAKEFGMYQQRMLLTDVKTGEQLFNGVTSFEAAACQFPYRGGFTEDAFSWVLSDTVIVDTVVVPPDSIKFGLQYNDERVFRSGKFTTGNFTKEGYCYSQYFNQTALGTLGFSFDFSIQQRGGRYRPSDNTALDKPSNVTTEVLFVKDGDVRDIDRVLVTQPVTSYITRRESEYERMPAFGLDLFGSYNNGPGEYVVTFEEGGEEEMEFIWDKDEKLTNTFKVKYLNISIYNKVSFVPPMGPSIVEYPGLMEHLVLPDSFPYGDRYYPDPRNLLGDNNSFIGKYNVSSYAWVNGKNNNSPPRMLRQQAWQTNKPEYIKLQYGTNAGVQGRYYLSALSTDGKDTVYFVNIFQIGGIHFVFDYLNKGRRFPGDVFNWDTKTPSTYVYGDDFKAGDQITLVSTGGALGLPLPGAKVRFKVTDAKPVSYTDQMLDQIKVVPNPYMISHEGQKSPYDAKIYFTKLPKRCSINIYTIMGDLVTTLEHDETSAYQDQESVEIWNLLSKNKQRVQSQTLVAIITTPDGAKTIKNFSVIVGGFRLIDEF